MILSMFVDFGNSFDDFHKIVYVCVFLVSLRGSPLPRGGPPLPRGGPPLPRGGPPLPRGGPPLPKGGPPLPKGVPCFQIEIVSKFSKVV